MREELREDRFGVEKPRNIFLSSWLGFALHHCTFGFVSNWWPGAFRYFAASLSAAALTDTCMCVPLFWTSACFLGNFKFLLDVSCKELCPKTYFFMSHPINKSLTKEMDVFIVFKKLVCARMGDPGSLAAFSNYKAYDSFKDSSVHETKSCNPSSRV